MNLIAYYLITNVLIKIYYIKKYKWKINHFSS